MVVSFCSSLSADVLMKFTVIVGYFLWNSAASFFIDGWLPTQDTNVIVVGFFGTATCVLGAEAGAEPPLLLAQAATATVSSTAVSRGRMACRPLRLGNLMPICGDLLGISGSVRPCAARPAGAGGVAPAGADLTDRVRASADS